MKNKGLDEKADRKNQDQPAIETDNPDNEVELNSSGEVSAKSATRLRQLTEKQASYEQLAISLLNDGDTVSSLLEDIDLAAKSIEALIARLDQMSIKRKQQFKKFQTKKHAIENKVNQGLDVLIHSNIELRMNCQKLEEKLGKARSDHRKKIKQKNSEISELKDASLEKLFIDAIKIRSKKVPPDDLPPLPEKAMMTVKSKLNLAFPKSKRGSDFVVDQLLKTNHIPLKYKELLAVALLRSKHGTMIDVGANIGMTSIPPALLGLFSDIIALEPSQQNFECLNWNVQANGLVNKIQVRRQAVGEKVGTAQLGITEACGLHHLSGEADSDVVAYEDVSMTTLNKISDEVASAGGKVGFVKIDTQGAELRILRGAGKLFSRRVPMWEIEFWPTGLKNMGEDPKELLDLFEAKFDWFMDEKVGIAGLRPISDLRASANALTGIHHTDYLFLP